MNVAQYYNTFFYHTCTPLSSSLNMTSVRTIPGVVLSSKCLKADKRGPLSLEVEPCTEVLFLSHWPRRDAEPSSSSCCWQPCDGALADSEAERLALLSAWLDGCSSSTVSESELTSRLKGGIPEFDLRKKAIFSLKSKESHYQPYCSEDRKVNSHDCLKRWWYWLEGNHVRLPAGRLRVSELVDFSGGLPHHLLHPTVFGGLHGRPFRRLERRTKRETTKDLQRGTTRERGKPLRSPEKERRGRWTDP